MARQLICGWLNLDDYTYYDIQMPAEPVMYAYPGEGGGAINGMKAKEDYNKNLWFIACDNPSQPAVMYLVRVTRLPGNTYTMAWKQIPLYDETKVAYPNQVTADKNGNVYFPAGYPGNPDSDYWVAKVTNAQAPDPDDWTITWYNHAGPADAEIVGSFGIALSKDHLTLVTYVCDYADKHTDFFAVLTCATMAEVVQRSAAIQSDHPYNIETDVSGGGNDGYWFIIIDTGPPSGWSLVAYKPGQVVVVNALTAQTERTVLIKTTGVVVSGDPTGTDEYAYPVVGAGVLGVGVLNSTPGPATQNHGDAVRVSPAALVNYRYWAFGRFGGQGGEVREVGALQNTRVATANYKYPSTAAVREAYS